MSEAIFARTKRATLQIQRCYPLTAPEPERFTLRLLLLRLAQSFRLMVGVHDYGNYVRHMQQKHPRSVPMTEKEFHRYCLDARFPSQAGKIGKCPC